MVEKNNSNLKRRMIFSIILTIVLFLGFVVRLFDWQIVKGKEFTNLALESINYTLTSDSTRGEIFDTNGKPLAVNETGYNVVINKLYMKDVTSNEIILKLFEILKYRDDKWIDNLPIELKDGKYSFVDGEESNIEELRSKDMLDLSVYSQPEEFIDKLAKRYGVEKTEDKETQRNLISVRYNMEKMAFKNTNPYVFAEDISDEMVLILSEKSQGLSGVEVQTTNKRTNKNPTVAPHIVGATGAITEEEFERIEEEGKENYKFNDKIGKFGIEQSFEDILKGKPGEKILQKNPEDKSISVAEVIPAEPGNSIFLTINSEYQKVANKILEKNIKTAKAEGLAAVNYAKQSNASRQSGFGEDCEAGAVVMLRVEDFAVLAAASYPGYDLQKYSKYDDYYVKLAKDKTTPMYDRAFVGSFAPGSVHKPVVALAGLEEGVITRGSTINCTRYYDYYPSDVVSCMGYHGPLSIIPAISHSCNYYFAEVGRRLGIDTMYLYAEKFGLGAKTGLEIFESKGTLAGRDSKEWYVGNTVQAAIGQSDNAFTPVQLATYVATIANNGTRNKTHLVDKITDYSHEKIIKENKKENPEIIEKINISEENLKIVQEGMRSVITDSSGTANYAFGSYEIPIAGKTGTAENPGSDHTLFMCYAPYEKPEVAVAVVLEHGVKGKFSADVAKAMLDAYFFDKTEKDIEDLA